MKATSNLAVIRRIRFKIKTHHRIYPDSLCATKWLETKPVQSLQQCVIPTTLFPVHVCVCVCVAWLRETTDVSGFAMTSFFMVAVCADRPCVHRPRQIAHVLAEKILLHEEIRAETQEMSLSLLSQSIKAIRKRMQFSSFFFEIYAHIIHTYNTLARERVNKHTWHFR